MSENSPKGTREKWNRNRCVWCAAAFKCNQSRTATCSNKCRLRLHRYRAETGFNPEKPPGKITAAAALDLLIVTLIRRERDRRLEAAAR